MNQKSGSKSVAWKFRFATLFFIFSVLLSISIAGFGTIMASGAAVGIDPASQEVSAGDTFTVNVTVDPAGYGVSSGSVKIVFDAAVMQVDSVVAGDLLGASPIVPSGFPKIDNTNGTVYVELARAGVTPVPTAKGTFATITFTVRSIAPPGTYAIDITTAVFADENYADISGITLNNGTVTVTTVDTTPPTIEFIAPTPADGSTVTVNYVNVTVNVTDPSGVSTVLLNWNGLNETMNMTADNTWSVNKTGLSNGDYTFKVYANDTYDNWGASEARTVNVMTAAAPTVSINPASQDVSAGDTFTVNIAVDPAGYGVSSGSITVSFDATVMQADSVVAGDLLGTSPIVPPGFPKIDNINGTIQIDLARSGTTIPPTPEGTWAVITFTVNSDALDGTHTIGITAAELADENFANIPGIKTNNGTVTIVTGYPRWDINNDGTVNYIDLAILGAHYGETTETPYPRYDINEDGTVNYIDLAILGAHYGENYITTI